MSWAEALSLRERLYFARRRAGYTQAQLAERLGVSRGAISTWERGPTMIPGDVLLEWSVVCEAPWILRTPARCA